MKKYVLYAISFFISLISNAQELLPTSSTGEIIEHTYFTLSYSKEHLQAEWVYYILTPELVKGSATRTNDFRPDPTVSVSANLTDYRGSGYDRGHLCPAADMKLNHTSMSETFYLSNMSPQHPSFNRGIWSNLEAVVRSWALELGEVYVVTGAVLSSSNGNIGNSEVTVPNYYYKVIYDPLEPKMIGFILPNEKGTLPLEDYVVSVDSVQMLTGINFFYALEDSLQNILEKQSNPSLWSFSQYRSNPANINTTSVQCSGIAKSTGVRCKSKTTNKNGYCNAHQSQAPVFQESAQNGRCIATTAKGTRCKRIAQEDSKYCWQHKRNKLWSY